MQLLEGCSALGESLNKGQLEVKTIANLLVLSRTSRHSVKTIKQFGQTGMTRGPRICKVFGVEGGTSFSPCTGLNLVSIPEKYFFYE